MSECLFDRCDLKRMISPKYASWTIKTNLLKKKKKFMKRFVSFVAHPNAFLRTYLMPFVFPWKRKDSYSCWNNSFYQQRTEKLGFHLIFCSFFISTLTFFLIFRNNTIFILIIIFQHCLEPPKQELGANYVWTFYMSLDTSFHFLWQEFTLYMSSTWISNTIKQIPTFALHTLL